MHPASNQASSADGTDFVNGRIGSPPLIVQPNLFNLKQYHMKTYAADIIPRIRKFSQRLDNEAALTEKHWVVVDEETDVETIYIFRRERNELLLSRNGRIQKCRWELVGGGSLLIDHGDESYLFKHGFMDNAVLALKRQGTGEYAILVNESELPRIGYELRAVTNYLESAYNTEILGSFVRQHKVEAAQGSGSGSGDPVYDSTPEWVTVTLLFTCLFLVAVVTAAVALFTSS